MNKKIFIISTDKEVTGNITNELNEYKWHYFQSGEKSIGLIEKESPDLIIINLKNKDISGFELCRLIKNNYKIPIITFTDDDELSNLVRAQQEGADACLFLPFKKKELKSIIEKLL